MRRRFQSLERFTRSSMPTLATLAALVPGGCAEPPNPGLCSITNAPRVAIANRAGLGELVDDEDLDIFLPPQGGVFTELDVNIFGLALEDLERVEVIIEAEGFVEPVAEVTYQSEALLMWCSEEGALQMDNLPVGFREPLSHFQLDGKTATLEARLGTGGADVSSRYPVVLEWVDY